MIRLVGVGVFVLPLRASARIERFWTYSDLQRLADPIVIAVPAPVKDTQERIARFSAKQANQKLKDIVGAGVETTFEILCVLKGNVSTNIFALHHYHLADAVKAAHYQIYDIGYLWFEPKDNNCYLLFLRREVDGRYAPMSGQTRPAISVHELQGEQP